MLSHEDKKDVAKAFGSKVAGKVASATNDAKNKAIHAKASNPGIDSTPIRKPVWSAKRETYFTPSKYDANEWSKKNLGRGSFSKMNAERKKQGYKAKGDRATKGLYDFLDKFD